MDKCTKQQMKLEMQERHKALWYEYENATSFVEIYV
jgi:hypothetical protein